jgi:hypothetical protein
LTYTPSTATNGNVVASLTFNKTGVIIDSTYHLFTGNGEYTFTYHDQAGNTGSAIAKVDRIDTTPPTATNLTFSPASLTSGNVLATLTLSETGNVP